MTPGADEDDKAWLRSPSGLILRREAIPEPRPEAGDKAMRSRGVPQPEGRDRCIERAGVPLRWLQPGRGVGGSGRVRASDRSCELVECGRDGETG